MPKKINRVEFPVHVFATPGCAGMMRCVTRKVMNKTGMHAGLVRGKIMLLSEWYPVDVNADDVRLWWILQEIHVSNKTISRVVDHSVFWCCTAIVLCVESLKIKFVIKVHKWLRYHWPRNAQPALKAHVTQSLVRPQIKMRSVEALGLSRPP